MNSIFRIAIIVILFNYNANAQEAIKYKNNGLTTDLGVGL